MPSSLDVDLGQLSCRQQQDVAVLEVRSDLFSLATDLDAKEQLLALLDRIEGARDVRSLLVQFSPDALDETGYEHFLRLVMADGVDCGPGSPRTDMEKEQLLSREEYGISQFIMRVHGLAKITVAGLCGTVAPPFVGLALAFDCRLVTEDTTLSFSFSRFGVPPTGGLGFLLPLYVGQGRAMELVLAGRPLDAATARTLGLVTRVMPADGFAESCLSAVHDLVGLPAAVAGAAKSLLAPYHEEELASYLERECEVLRSTWRRHALHAGVPAAVADTPA